MNVREMGIAPPAHLPPLDAWKTDPRTIKKFFAPTDDRGFVLPEATIDVVKDMFDGEYEWPVDFRFQQTQPDKHHFQWYKELYEPRRYQGRTIPKQFRNLPTVLGIMPRQFHNVIHSVTLPPLQPKYKEMEQHVRAYTVARKLFESAHLAAATKQEFSITADRRDDVANAMLIRRFSKQFERYRLNVEEMMEIQGVKTLELDIPKFPNRAPKDVARALGVAAAGKAIDFMPRFETQQLDAS